MAKLKFLTHYNLQTTGIGLQTVARMSEAELDMVAGYLHRHDLSLSLIVGAPYIDAPVDELRRSLDTSLAQLERYRGLLRTRLVTTSAGRYHRFMRDPSLERQLERLAEALPVLAEGCYALGLPLGIENHGDYYCSDLVELCKHIPQLGIFLDTGNPFLIGEAPLPAFRAAAPYVVGTHFKDHHVQPRPEARPLHFEVAPAVLGEGDACLRECYRILLDHAPNPRSLVMELELIPPPEMDSMKAFERSLAFIRSLPEPQ